MQTSVAANRKLPFRCRLVCVSLVAGTLAVAGIFLLFYTGYISAGAAIWAATGVFVLAALYEAFLLSLITRHMLRRVNEHP